MEPIELVQSVYAAFGRGDVAAILDATTDDVDWCRTVEGVPHLRHGIGREAVAAYFEAAGSSFDFHGFAPRAFAGAGPKVLVVLDVELTVRSTGKRLAFDEVHEFDIVDGRIARYRPHLDTALLVDACR